MRNSAYCAVLLSLLFCFAQVSIGADVPCSAKTGPAGWRTFVDRAHRFCFRYPPIYKPVRDSSERRSILALESDGEIYVWLDKRAFKLQELDAFSRSGNPPSQLDSTVPRSIMSVREVGECSIPMTTCSTCGESSCTSSSTDRTSTIKPRRKRPRN
jgi:hypothetical protein